MGCGIALLIGLIAVGGLVYWGVKKTKDFMAEWGENPGLGAVAMVVAIDDTYEMVGKDLEAGTLTIKNTSTGEESTWTLQEMDEDSDSIQLIDDQGRIITFGQGDKAFTVSEPGAAEIEDAAAEAAPVEETVEEEM